MPDPNLMETIVNLTKRRGFVFPSDEIYGGLRSNYDWGPLGVQLMRNVKDAWWNTMVQLRSDVVGLDAAILTNPRVFEASGHLSGFTDPLVECKECHTRHRADQLDGSGACPSCGKKALGEAREFNLMFKTNAGPVVDDSSVVYLRPETAQGIFVNFKNVLETCRTKPPFGIAQIGKSFRNEITPGNFVFRTREFEQMEMEFFVHPDEEPKWFEYWVQARMEWYTDLGMSRENLRLYEHPKEDLSHYSIGTTDVEYAFPWGWGELEGVARRTDYDLKQHAQHSGERLDYFDPQTNDRYTPYVVEPAAGVTRSAMAFLLDAYAEDEVGGETRQVLRLHHKLAPYKVAVLPLSKKETLTPLAKEILASLQPLWMCEYDETQSIGRRYRRQDEIGTPYAVTVDFDSLEDKAVTVRQRDTTEQTRVSIDQLIPYLAERLR